MVQQPLMLFSANDSSGTDVLINFDQSVIEVDVADPLVLNSIRIWSPTDNFQGTCTALVRVSTTRFTATFDVTPAMGEEAAVWIFDERDFFRGLNTGARCTGNPYVFEGT